MESRSSGRRLFTIFEPYRRTGVMRGNDQAARICDYGCGTQRVGHHLIRRQNRPLFCKPGADGRGEAADRAQAVRRHNAARSGAAPRWQPSRQPDPRHRGGRRLRAGSGDQSALAEVIGSRSRASEILRRKRSTPLMAIFGWTTKKADRPLHQEGRPKEARGERGAQVDTGTNRDEFCPNAFGVGERWDENRN